MFDDRPQLPNPIPLAPRLIRVGLAAGLAAALVCRAAAADELKPIWDLKLGLSYVATSGNSQTSTLGANVDYTRRFELWSLAAFASAVNAAKDGSTSAERYVAGARANYPLTPRLALVGGVKGEKDRFAGFDLRGIVDAGVEWKLIDTKLYAASVLGGLTWTHEKPVVGSTDSTFGGLAGIRAALKLSPTSEATGTATFYPSFEQGDDWRLEGGLGVQAAISELLALKVSWELRYDNVPVPGFRKTDTVTLVSLVLNTASATTR